MSSRISVRLVVGVLLALFCTLCSTSPRKLWGSDTLVIPVWPNAAPGLNGKVASDNQAASKNERDIQGAMVAGRAIQRLTDIDSPTLQVFAADPAHATGTAVIVCPGGGYSLLAHDLEGTEIAEWLQGIGVTAFVLKYRVPKIEGEEPGTRPLMDLQRAIRLVRSRAAQWQLNPNRIGVLGFSAGGHLAVSAAVADGEENYQPLDAIDSLDPVPNFVIPIYPAYLAESGSQPAQLRSAIRVTPKTPPMFLAVTNDDADRGVGAALLSIALKQNDVPNELHVFVKGGHGYGLRESENAVSQWPALCEQWLAAMNLLPLED